MGLIDLEGIGKKKEQNFCCFQTIWDLVETFGRTAKVSSPHLVWNLRVFAVFHIASKAWVKSHSSNHSEGLYVVIEKLRSNAMIQECSLAELDLNSQIKPSVARSCLLATGCCYNNVKVKITVICSLSFCL